MPRQKLIKDLPLACSICGGTIKPNWTGWAKGHNAAPVTDGRACDDCNDLVVIPMRLRRLGFHTRRRGFE